LENSKLKNLKIRFDSLISKLIRLENNEKSYQNEMKKLQEENINLKVENNKFKIKEISQEICQDNDFNMPNESPNNDTDILNTSVPKIVEVIEEIDRKD
ncbi:7155_t:CDS:2, partial [Racocetra fulgida]